MRPKTTFLWVALLLSGRVFAQDVKLVTAENLASMPASVRELIEATDSQPISPSADPSFARLAPRLQAMLGKLVNAGEFPGNLHLVIVDSIEPNAFLSAKPDPDNHLIGITLGAFKLAKSDDEIALVFSHEIEHRFSDIQKRVDSIEVGMHWAEKLALRRSIEIEVDVRARERAKKKGFNPDAGADFLNRIKDQFGESIVQTHATTSSRTDVLGGARVMERRALGTSNAVAPRTEMVDDIRKNHFEQPDFEKKQRARLEELFHFPENPAKPLYENILSGKYTHHPSHEYYFNIYLDRSLARMNAIGHGFLTDEEKIDLELRLHRKWDDLFEEARTEVLGGKELTLEQLRFANHVDQRGGPDGRELKSVPGLMPFEILDYPKKRDESEDRIRELERQERTSPGSDDERLQRRQEIEHEQQKLDGWNARLKLARKIYDVDDLDFEIEKYQMMKETRASTDDLDWEYEALRKSCRPNRDYWKRDRDRTLEGSRGFLLAAQPSFDDKEPRLHFERDLRTFLESTEKNPKNELQPVRVAFERYVDATLAHVAKSKDGPDFVERLEQPGYSFTMYAGPVKIAFQRLLQFDQDFAVKHLSRLLEGLAKTAPDTQSLTHVFAEVKSDLRPFGFGDAWVPAEAHWQDGTGFVLQTGLAAKLLSGPFGDVWREKMQAALQAAIHRPEGVNWRQVEQLSRQLSQAAEAQQTASNAGVIDRDKPRALTVDDVKAWFARRSGAAPAKPNPQQPVSHEVVRELRKSVAAMLQKHLTIPPTDELVDSLLHAMAPAIYEQSKPEEEVAHDRAKKLFPDLVAIAKHWNGPKAIIAYGPLADAFLKASPRASRGLYDALGEASDLIDFSPARDGDEDIEVHRSLVGRDVFLADHFLQNSRKDQSRIALDLLHAKRLAKRDGTNASQEYIQALTNAALARMRKHLADAPQAATVRDKWAYASRALWRDLKDWPLGWRFYSGNSPLLTVQKFWWPAFGLSADSPERFSAYFGFLDGLKKAADEGIYDDIRDEFSDSDTRREVEARFDSKFALEEIFERAALLPGDYIARPHEALEALGHYIDLVGSTNRTDAVFEKLRPFWEKDPQASKALLSEQWVGRLHYDLNRVGLAKWQLEQKFGIASKAQSYRARKEPLPKEGSMRRDIARIRDSIDKQFGEPAAAKNEILDHIQKELLTNDEETRFLDERAVNYSNWAESRKLILLDSPHIVDRAMNTQYDRWEFLSYLMGDMQNYPSFSKRANGHPKREEVEEFLRIAKDHFQKSDPYSRTYQLQPTLDFKTGLMSDPAMRAKVMERLLGPHHANDIVQKVVGSYLRNVPESEAKYLIGYVLANSVGQPKGKPASLKTVLEAAGPFGIKVGQFLRTTGVVPAQYREELEKFFDQALPPSRGEVYEKLKRAFGDKLHGIESVRQVVGSGSVNYVVLADIVDPRTQQTRPVVVRVLRDSTEGRVRNENEIWDKVIEDLRADPDATVRKVGDIALEAQADVMDTLRSGGSELSQRRERDAYDSVRKTYETGRVSKSGYRVRVAQPVQSIQSLIPEDMQDSMSIFEFISHRPLKEIPEQALRAELAEVAARAELDALASGNFDPDGHPGNWPNDLDNKEVVRIDYAKFRTLPPDETRAFLDTSKLMLKPQLGDADLRELERLSRTVFVIEGKNGTPVNQKTVVAALKNLVRDPQFPDFKEPHQRLFFLRNLLERALPGDSRVRFGATARAALSSLSRSMFFREEMGVDRYQEILLETLGVTRSTIARNYVAGLGKQAVQRTVAFVQSLCGKAAAALRRSK